MNKKILYMAGGIISVILGILAIFHAELALYLFSAVLMVYGISGLMKWFEGRKSGTSSIWTLLGASLSIMLSICLLIGNNFTDFAATQIVLLFSLWLIIIGGFEILGAIMYRKAMTSVDLGVQAPGSVTSLILGSVMTIVGFLALFVPMIAIVTAHIWITTGLIFTGIRLIMMARSSGELEGNT